MGWFLHLDRVPVLGVHLLVPYFFGGEVNLGNTDSDKTDTFVERCSKNNTDNEPNSEHQVSTLGCTLR